MPYLTSDYVHRFLRVNAVCREAFDSRVELNSSDWRHETGDHLVWRHADLFLAGFPRIGVKPGYDLLCYFTRDDANRKSGIVGYAKDCPEMVPDIVDQQVLLYQAEQKEPMVCDGTALQDEEVLLVPRMPSGWQYDDRHNSHPWLMRDPNIVLTDDGTPEGAFERAQFLLWSTEPVNRWHAVGYGHHRICMTPVTPNDQWRPVDADGRMLEKTEQERSIPLPDIWLPRVELRLAPSARDWAPLPGEHQSVFAGKPCNVVRFYTHSGHYPAAFYEVTVWFTEDAWHSNFRTVLEGGGGYIC